MNSPSSAHTVPVQGPAQCEAPDFLGSTRGGQEGGGAATPSSVSAAGDPSPLTQAINHLQAARQLLREVYCVVPVGQGAATDMTRQELIEASAQASDLSSLVGRIARRLRPGRTS